MAQIIDGKEVSKKLLYEIKVETEQLRQKYEYKPGLAVIIVGDDYGSKVYVKRKREACEITFNDFDDIFLHSFNIYYNQINKNRCLF